MKKKRSGPKKSKAFSMIGEKTTINGSGRKYELIGLSLLAFGMIAGIGILGWNVGFIGFLFADIFHYLFGWGALIAILIVILIGIQYKYEQ